MFWYLSRQIRWCSWSVQLLDFFMVIGVLYFNPTYTCLPLYSGHLKDEHLRRVYAFSLELVFPVGWMECQLLIVISITSKKKWKSRWYHVVVVPGALSKDLVSMMMPLENILRSASYLSRLSLSHVYWVCKTSTIQILLEFRRILKRFFLPQWS